MLKNERGITLLEILAALVISSIIIGIIYSFLIIAVEYNSTETTKTRLQQEANYITTEIQRVHRKSDCYVLIIDSGGVIIAEECKDTDGDLLHDNTRVLTGNFEYSIEREETPIIYQVFPHGKKASQNEEIGIHELAEIVIDGDFILENFTVSDPANETLDVKISTAFTRYRIDEESNDETTK